MPTTIFSTRETQFSYFNQVLDHTPWRGLKVLDFGGNTGVFLKGADNHVNHTDYWCMDINRAVIEQGKLTYPDANFIHFDRYSSEFNPQGIRNLPIPEFGIYFDRILAFSVFTHLHQVEMVELIAQLRSMLKPDGQLAFTFTVPGYDRRKSNPSLEYDTGVRNQLERNREYYPELSDRDIEQIVNDASQSSWCVLIEDKLYLQPGEDLSHVKREGKPYESYCVYYSEEYIRTLFQDSKIFPPVPPDWQHCCVLNKG